VRLTAWKEAFEEKFIDVVIFDTLWHRLIEIARLSRRLRLNTHSYIQGQD
jgi:hypothetical protein